MRERCGSSRIQSWLSGTSPTGVRTILPSQRQADGETPPTSSIVTPSSKIGLDVTLEALREAWRARRFTMDEMDRYARICRVARVMRPYLEALVA